MELATLCVFVASVRVVPNRSQFFQYETVSLDCGEPGNSSEWRVKRKTSADINKECSIAWGKRNGSQCLIDDLYQSDSGVYWCESGDGECSDAVNITVTGGSVILESPVVPVREGDAVTLRCTSRATSSANLAADFYKDGLLIGRSSTGDLTLRNVCEADQGFYKCNITGAGESPDSWLAVRAEQPESVRSSLANILLPVVGACLSLASLMLLCLWRSHKETDTEPTLYSTIKPGAT
ncbi:low affinity immunoglobulin gamma Fc region receptor II-like isoform X2 [Xiphias gladius]|uniref:low affinity immunoglobulin gamma Fc region receptor II-like isoform X2 n=1 Tax=Xiphias gladius TaxID=8245 RepID=UPI001A9A1D81|nr:low affinity immunoglobulin gamma Fc region receptor II-like isoform X2 [Xiphias gladius]